MSKISSAGVRHLSTKFNDKEIHSFFYKKLPLRWDLEVSWKSTHFGPQSFLRVSWLRTPKLQDAWFPPYAKYIWKHVLCYDVAWYIYSITHKKISYFKIKIIFASLFHFSFFFDLLFLRSTPALKFPVFFLIKKSVFSGI